MGDIEGSGSQDPLSACRETSPPRRKSSQSSAPTSALGGSHLSSKHPALPFVGTLWLGQGGGGAQGGNSAWTYLELQAGRAQIVFHSTPAPRIPGAFCTPSHSHTSWRQRKGGAGFSHAVRNFAGRSAPPWRPCLGGRLGAAGRGAEPDSPGPGGRDQGVRSAWGRSPGSAVRLPPLRALPGLGLTVLPLRRRGARLSPPEAGVLFTLSSCCPEAEALAWVRYCCLCRSRAGREPPPHRGCSGRSRRNSLLELGFPTLRGPWAGSAAAAAVRTTSGQRSLCHGLQRRRRRWRGSHGDRKGGDLQTPSSGRPGGGLG